MSTGPQKYPGASTAYWWQSKYGGDAMDVNVIVWHSTEGSTLPGYSGGAVAPNLTAVPDFKAKKLTWFQHFDFDTSSRALVHSGVATNTLNVCQVEIVGTCDPTTHAKWTKAGVQHLYMPELPDWAVRDLAAFAKWAHDKHGVPLASGLTFKAYPGSYGTGNGVRMSDAKWLDFRGHCGHQHVPGGNVHGDPGAFPMAAILAAAKSAAGSSSSSTSSATRPSVSLSKLIAAAKYDPAKPGTPVSYSGVKTVEAALVAEKLLAAKYADGHFGSATITAYAALQRRYGYEGSAADGIPGKASLTRLGNAHGFDVKE